MPRVVTETCCLSADTVGIAHREVAFIRGGFFDIQNAAREHARRPKFKKLARSPNLFIANAQKRHCFAPACFARFAILYRDRGVAVVIARDFPLKAEIVNRGGFDNEFACGHSIGILRLDENQTEADSDYVAAQAGHHFFDQETWGRITHCVIQIPSRKRVGKIACQS